MPRRCATAPVRFIKVSTRSDPGPRIGAVILAAGASRRLGRPKQLVIHEGRTLVERSILAATGAGAEPVVVVLGAHADEVSSVVPKVSERARIVLNENWNDGMGTSIACGVKELLKSGRNIEAVLILVCDQPALDKRVLGGVLAQSQANPGRIILCDYGDGRGPPVCFPREFLGELADLTGDAGAASIHRKHADLVTLVSFPGGALDIDTADDLDRAES